MFADHSRDFAVAAAAADGFNGYRLPGEESNEAETNIETTHAGTRCAGLYRVLSRAYAQGHREQ